MNKQTHIHTDSGRNAIARAHITDALLYTQREGIEDMIKFLDSSDFYIAPASRSYHLAQAGGLAEHSWNVYDTSVKLNKVLSMHIPKVSLAISALLHDACKIDCYHPVDRWRKDAHDEWESYAGWDIDESLPLGHGEKSVYVINKYIRLTDAEAAAIRWHHGAFTPGVVVDYTTLQTYNLAIEKYPLVLLLHIADMTSARILETRVSSVKEQKQ